MKEPQHNQLNWLHVYYVCRYFICLNMDLIMQTGAKQSEFQAVGDCRGGGRWEERGGLESFWRIGWVQGHRCFFHLRYTQLELWAIHSKPRFPFNSTDHNRNHHHYLIYKYISAFLIGINTLDSSSGMFAIDLTVCCNLLCGRNLHADMIRLV